MSAEKVVILGISAYYHDSAAAIIVDGEIIAAAQEERFTRIKHDPSFPSHSIQFCLEEAGYKIDDLSAVAFYDKPFLKFERLLKTYYEFSPRGLRSFIKAIPIWVKEKLFLKREIKNGLSQVQDYSKNDLVLLFPEHHLSHGASAYYPSPYNEAAILTIDGVGEWATATISHGKNENIQLLKEMHFPDSVGLLYSSFTYFLGFRVNSGEYKLMGLAPYGNPHSPSFKKYVQIIKSELVEIFEDGSIILNKKFFNYHTGLTMVKKKLWGKLFSLPYRNPEDKIDQKHMDLALAIQFVTEEIVLKLARHAKDLAQSKNLVLSGGVALNCVANGKLHTSNIFDSIWIQPASGDAGGSLGAALASYYLYFKANFKEKPKSGDLMKGAFLGPEFFSNDIIKMAKNYKANYTQFHSIDDLTRDVAQVIADGNVVGWMQGKMEFGPRALGHRSILGDARDPEMQKKINLKIKYRESFRPFAPSILLEDVGDFFDHEGDSPYMLLVKEIKESNKKSLPDNYHSLPLLEKLQVPRSEIPSITHVDYSGRIQTVDGSFNPNFSTLIEKFKDLSGVGILINTSFNVRGEPIVCTPEDAYRCFMRTEMDYLVINEFLFYKNDQPNWDQFDSWREEFVLD